MEWWNIGMLIYKRILSIFYFIVNTNFTINPIRHYPRTPVCVQRTGRHYSIIPAFPGPDLIQCNLSFRAIIVRFNIGAASKSQVAPGRANIPIGAKPLSSLFHCPKSLMPRVSPANGYMTVENHLIKASASMSLANLRKKS